MGRPAFAGHDGRDLLGFDSLLSISDVADDLAEAGRGNGLDDADYHADGSAFGLEIAATAPDSVPADPDGPPSSGLSDIIAIDVMSYGKGGTKGGPNTGGTGGETQTVTASFVSGTPDTSTVDNYNIQVDFYGSLWVGDYGGKTYDLGEAFVAAANFLSSIIAEGANDVYDFLGNLAYDDLIIEAHITDIDGAGGVLGQAGPTGIRTSDGLTATGLMEFDSADALYYASLGLWDDIVFHEMMHVLGVGTLWDYNNLLQTTSVLLDDKGTKRPTDDIYSTTIIFTGTEATAANDGTLYVEQDGGSGTAGGHWNEILANYFNDPNGYDNEIMTGFIDNQNYLSAFSVASLVDIGYTLESTDYAELAAPQSTEIVLVSDTGYADLIA